MTQALRLHGYPVSNYFNTARAALIEKGLSGDFVPTRAEQDEAFLSVSPMGKIPYLMTEQGGIAETVAILEYLEDIQPEPPLLPADPFARARVRQVVNIVQVYVEAPLRSLFPGVFMGGKNEPLVVASARPTIERGMRALSYLVAPRPFLMGGELTLADLFAFYTFDVGDRLTRFVYDWSLLGSLPGLRDWHGMMAGRASSRVVLADFATAFEAYLRDKGAAWREPEMREHDHA